MKKTVILHGKLYERHTAIGMQLSDFACGWHANVYSGGFWLRPDQCLKILLITLYY